MKTNTAHSLTEKLHLEDVPVSDQADFLEEISTAVFENTLARIIGKMDENTLHLLSAFLETNPSEEALSAFITKRVPGAEAEMQDVLRELGDGILGATQQ